MINISSLGGYQSGAGFGVVLLDQFAVEGLSEALHGELAPLGIHVTVVEPGYFLHRLPGRQLAGRVATHPGRLCPKRRQGA